MRLLPVSQPEQNVYDRFVAEQETGSFLQSWEWGEWQKSLGRPVERFWCCADNGTIIGCAQLVKMSLPLGHYYWYAPYGPVMSWRFAQQDLDKFIQEIKNQFPEAWFMRFEPKINANFELRSKNSSMVKSVNIQPGSSVVVDLTSSPEALLAAMHPKTRYNIRLAARHQVEVHKDLVVSPGHGFYYKEAVDLIVETALRQGYKGHTRKYYENLVNFFARGGKNVTLSVYKALYKNQLLASAIMVDFGFVRTYLFGGSSGHDKQVMAPYALHWQAMLDARSAGMKGYDFWGLETAGGKTAGFARFKAGFGGRFVRYAGAYDAVFQIWAYRAYRLLRSAARIFGA